MPEIHELAGEAYDAMETRTRDDGESFVALKDDRPDWVYDIVYAAHGGDFLPDDYRFQWAQEAFEYIHEAGESADDDLADEFADGVDVYTNALYAWLSSNLTRSGYCDQAQGEGLVGPDDTLAKRITIGQYMERREVFGLVIEALREHAETLEPAE